MPGCALGSAVDVLHTSVSPSHMMARRSYWRPSETTVKLMTTLLKEQLGGSYLAKDYVNRYAFNAD